MRKRHYLLVDAQRMPCVWVIVNGHVDEITDAEGVVNRFLRGTVVLRGPDFSRDETHPIADCVGGHSYQLGLSGTSHVVLEDYMSVQIGGRHA